MPTRSSYPDNMQTNNVVLSRSGARWKAYETLGKDLAVPDSISGITLPQAGKFVYPKRYNVAGMVRPFFNKQGGSSYEAGARPVHLDPIIDTLEGNPATLAYPGTGKPYGDYSLKGDANAYRARPMKQWRLQYGDVNNKQSFINNYMIEQLSKPGGAIMSGRREDGESHCIMDLDRCQTIDGVIPYEVGELTTVGRYNPAYLRYKNEDGREDNNYFPSRRQACDQCPLYQCRRSVDNEVDCHTIGRCINICDPPSKAKRLVRYTSRIDTPWVHCERPYYVNYKYYLEARCKTYKQKSFQFRVLRDDDDDDAEYGVRSCGKSAYRSRVYRSNCPALSGVTCLNDLISGAYSGKCSKVYYKPNNCQFAQQGAVSGSSRILRLKKNTIDKNARTVGNSYGLNTANALAYSATPETPFINKNKMNAGGYSRKCRGTVFGYPCDTSLYHLYRPGGGNPVTSAMNDSYNNKIIGHFCTTSEWPGQGYGDKNNIGKGFIFMERQSRDVRLHGVGGSIDS